LDSEWGKAYAGWSLPRLEARQLELEATYNAELERLYDWRFEANLYRTVSGQEMEGVDSSYDVLAAFDAQGVLTRTRAVLLDSEDPSQPISADPAGRMEYRVVSLAPDVYPQVYKQRDELEWLRATLAARTQELEDHR
jgi:hypothetical protein